MGWGWDSTEGRTQDKNGGDQDLAAVQECAVACKHRRACARARPMCMGNGGSPTDEARVPRGVDQRDGQTRRTRDTNVGHSRGGGADRVAVAADPVAVAGVRGAAGALVLAARAPVAGFALALAVADGSVVAVPMAGARHVAGGAGALHGAVLRGPVHVAEAGPVAGVAVEAHAVSGTRGPCSGIRAGALVVAVGAVPGNGIRMKRGLNGKRHPCVLCPLGQDPLVVVGGGGCT